MGEVYKYPRFSVIIPQKDRAEYLRYTLLTCMNQDYPNYEIIVSDDCSEDNSVEVVKELQQRDSRITLYAHTKHLGMRDNFEFALSKVRPGYVLALGGDDGLAPNSIFRMYEILKSTNRKLLAWNPAGYLYSDLPGKDIFNVKRCKKNKPQIIKSSDYLNKIAKSFYYCSDDSPMFYVKGVVSTDVVDIVKSRTPDHCFYYCPTPDGFSGVVLAGEVEDYVYTNEPLSLVGSSPKSQGKNYHRTDEKSKAEAQQFFNDNIRRTMHKDLASQPYSPLVTLMTADYLLTARDLPGWPGKFEMFSFEDLIRKTFQFIARSSFEEETLVRELRILKAIAEQHGLLDLFDELYKKTKRKVVYKEDVSGFVITNSIRFSGAQLHMSNIYDASLATNFLYNFYSIFSLNLLWELFVNFFKVVRRAKQHKIENLPII